MPLINCSCSHLIVCEHRGKIEEAFKRVCSTNSVKVWNKITEAMKACCPYRKAIEEIPSCTTCKKRLSYCDLQFRGACTSYVISKYLIK